MPPKNLPYWLVNVPETEWPTSCPDFLLNTDARDRELLGTPDAQYHLQTWLEVQHIISNHEYLFYITCNSNPLEETNRLDSFQRVPSDLRRYLEYNAKLKKEYGSVMAFVMQERLQWNDTKPKNPIPFSDPGKALS